MSINGTSLEGKTHGEAVSGLHQARLCSQALVVIKRSNDSELKSSDRGDSVSHSQSEYHTRKTSLETAAGRSYFKPLINHVFLYGMGSQQIHPEFLNVLCYTSI